jgi:hypothetical protein
VRTTPPAAGFPEAEEHILTTADGEKVIVWHVPARAGPSGRALLPWQWRLSRRLLRPLSQHHRRRHRGHRIVLSRLCGLDRATERARIAAGRSCAYAFTAARYRADDIVVWGFSLGTGVAVALAAEQRIGRLILEAPYTSIADVAASAVLVCPVRC